MIIQCKDQDQSNFKMIIRQPFFEIINGEKSYTLEEFNTLFLKNDVHTLEQVFTNIEFGNQDYEYDKMANMLVGDEQRQCAKNIYSSLTTIYQRLYSELEQDRKQQSVRDFSKVYAIMTLVNFELAKEKKQIVPIVSYLQEFALDKRMQMEVMLRARKEAKQIIVNHYEDSTSFEKYFKEYTYK